MANKLSDRQPIVDGGEVDGGMPLNPVTPALNSKNILSKRFWFKRSDSGLSSDSGEQCLPVSDHQSHSTFHHQANKASTASTSTITTMLDDDDDRLTEQHSSQVYETDDSTHYRYDQYYELSTVGHHGSDRRYSNANSFEDNFAFESKIAELTSQNDLINRKLMLMEEHIYDLTNENGSLYKKLSTQEDIYKKKIDFRDEEIQILKDNILQLDESLAEYRRRDLDHNQQRTFLDNEIKSLKKQLSTLNAELSAEQNGRNRIKELEYSYQQAMKTIEVLKNDKCDSLGRLEETYQSQCAAKQIEIDSLRAKIDELKQMVVAVGNTNTTTTTVSSVAHRTSPIKTGHDPDSKSCNTCSKICLCNQPMMDNSMMLGKHEISNSSINSNNNCDTEVDFDDSPISHNGDHHFTRNYSGGISLLNELDSNNNRLHFNSDSDRSDTANTTTTTTTTTTTEGELFPSLPDVLLRKLNLLRENTCSIETLSEQEIDSKFHTLALAFKTDKFTLDQRVKLYRHQRDVAECDAKAELNNLTEYISELKRVLFSCDSALFYKKNLIQLKELKEMLDRIDMQCQVIRASVMKISSRAELCGAVRQEEKLSTAFDVILLHLENLKRSKERDAKELEDVKRLLATNNKHDPDSDSEFASQHRRSVRQSKINFIRVRRASVASIDLKDINNRRFGINSTTTAAGTTTTTFKNMPVIEDPVPPSPRDVSPSRRRVSLSALEHRHPRRPRRKLLHLLSDSKCLEESEEDEETMKSEEDESPKDSNPETDEGSIDQLMNGDIHEERLLDLPSEFNREKKLSITPVDSVENTDLIIPNDLGVEEDLLANTNVDLEDEQTLMANHQKQNRNERFYKELIKRLEPLEALQLGDTTAGIIRFRDWIRKFFQSTNRSLWTTLDKIRNSSLARLAKNSHDEIRYGVSVFLVVISVVILFWSILLPFLS